MYVGVHAGDYKIRMSILPDGDPSAFNFDIGKNVDRALGRGKARREMAMAPSCVSRAAALGRAVSDETRSARRRPLYRSRAAGLEFLKGVAAGLKAIVVVSRYRAARA